MDLDDAKNIKDLSVSEIDSSVIGGEAIKEISDKDILKAINFQEKWFDIRVIRDSDSDDLVNDIITEEGLN